MFALEAHRCQLTPSKGWAAHVFTGTYAQIERLNQTKPEVGT